jgi:Zn-dependent protease
VFGGGSSIQLARVAGIRIGASPSWFVIVGLLIFILSGTFEDRLGGSQTEAFVVAALAALLFFFSIVLHELGHAFAARRSGIRVIGIDLWLFGGLAKLDRDSRTPGEEFRVAVAGPLVTLLVVGACFGASVLISTAGEAFDVATLSDELTTSPVELLIGFVGLMNAVILVFNLVPAFPLDGGRIARAAIWKLTNDRTRGTIVAAWLGQGFGLLLAVWGAFSLYTGTESAIGGLWWIVLGYLIGTSARSAAAGARVTERLEGVTVGDIMDASPVTMPDDTRLIEAEEQWFARYEAEWFAVVDEHNRLLGIAERSRVGDAVNAGQPALAVRDVLTPGEPVGTDQPLEAVVAAEPLRRLGAVMAVDANGVLRGVLTVEQVRRALTAVVP